MKIKFDFIFNYVWRGNKDKDKNELFIRTVDR